MPDAPFLASLARSGDFDRAGRTLPSVAFDLDSDFDSCRGFVILSPACPSAAESHHAKDLCISYPPLLLALEAKTEKGTA
jgi:hypothetical protein